MTLRVNERLVLLLGHVGIYIINHITATIIINTLLLSALLMQVGSDFPQRLLLLCNCYYTGYQ